jgi:hypothetical protein
MYFVTFWCGKCQTGSVVTVQSQFECGTIENITHALDVHAQRVLKYNFILIYDFTIIETGRFNVFL